MLLALLTMLPCTLTAQKSKKPEYIVKTIPSDMNIEDKIIVQNESSYLLSQVRVYLIDYKGKYQRLGTATNLKPDKNSEIRSYDNDRLANLRGCRIAVNIVGARGRTTSNFNVTLDDHRHDLYIEITDKKRR